MVIDMKIMMLMADHEDDDEGDDDVGWTKAKQNINCWAKWNQIAIKLIQVLLLRTRPEICDAFPFGALSHFSCRCGTLCSNESFDTVTSAATHSSSEEQLSKKHGRHSCQRQHGAFPEGVGPAERAPSKARGTTTSPCTCQRAQQPCPLKHSRMLRWNRLKLVGL